MQLTCQRIVAALQRPLVALQEAGGPLVVTQHLHSGMDRMPGRMPWKLGNQEQCRWCRGAKSQRHRLWAGHSWSPSMCSTQHAQHSMSE